MHTFLSNNCGTTEALNHQIIWNVLQIFVLIHLNIHTIQHWNCARMLYTQLVTIPLTLIPRGICSEFSAVYITCTLSTTQQL